MLNKDAEGDQYNLFAVKDYTWFPSGNYYNLRNRYEDIIGVECYFEYLKKYNTVLKNDSKFQQLIYQQFKKPNSGYDSLWPKFVEGLKLKTESNLNMNKRLVNKVSYNKDKWLSIMPKLNKTDTGLGLPEE